VIEVLPQNWQSILVLGESLSVKEIRDTLGLPQASTQAMLQVLNPSLQALDERTLAERSTLVVTTSALKAADSDLAVRQAIETATTKVANVVVMSPRLNLLRGAVAQELTDRGVVLRGRFRQLPGTPTLASSGVFVAPGTRLDVPRSKVRLKGQLTDESDSPYIMDVTATSSCGKLFFLAEQVDSVDQFTTGLSCRRTGGGSLVLMGFELADAEADDPRERVVPSWAESVLNLRVR
jgi:hypothetical protein